MPSAIARFCPCKINLFLEVFGKRPDGYHELASIFVPVDFGDTITVRRARRTKLTVLPAKAAPVRGNTVLRAVEAMRKRAGLRGGAEITLHKRVPPGSGLGGGSSDAAASILALDALYRLKAPPEALRQAAADVGSDVPFFLQPFPALVLGRGEIVVPLPPGPPLHFALLLPKGHLSTAKVYAKLRRSRKMKADLRPLITAWLAERPRLHRSAPYNALEEPACRLMPKLRTLLSRLRRRRLRAAVTGSGCGIFAVCSTRAQADRTARLIHEETDVPALAVSACDPFAGA